MSVCAFPPFKDVLRKDFFIGYSDVHHGNRLVYFLLEKLIIAAEEPGQILIHVDNMNVISAGRMMNRPIRVI